MAEAISPTPPTIDDAAKTNLTTQLSEYALVGLRVRVCAPQNMFHLKEGIVVSYESAAELYVVHLDHCKEELMIKGLAFFYKYWSFYTNPSINDNLEIDSEAGNILLSN